MKLLRSRLIRFKIRIESLFWRLKYTLFREKMPRNKDGKVYLNLGSGVNTSSEFINIDAIPFPKTHLVADIQNLSMFPSGSVDMVYASHLLEHIPRKNLEATLREWNRVLKIGGTLRFGVPDFDSLIRIYETSGRNVGDIVSQLMGEDGEYDDHHTIWNRTFAEEMLHKTGFTDIRPWDPARAEHHAFHDKTNRFFERGGESIPISLNLEAVKRA